MSSQISLKTLRTLPAIEEIRSVRESWRSYCDSEIDFGPGDALYKARSETFRYEEISLYYFPPTLRGGRLVELERYWLSGTGLRRLRQAEQACYHE